MSNKVIVVEGNDIQVDDDYICLTDMVRAEEGEDHIKNWLRTKETLMYLGAWERMHNEHFNLVEFDQIKKEFLDNKIILSVKAWKARTNAIGIRSKTGRYGSGTYAHKDIAFQFGMWISPEFQLLLVKEFQRLKDIESNSLNIEWNVKRVLSKANYHLHTAAIKDCIIPVSNVAKDKERWIYASEADLLNIAMFGCTAKEWKDANPDLANKGLNIRDIASINQLVVLSNIESLNSVMIRSGMDKKNRMEELSRLANHQLAQFDKIDIEKSYKRVIDGQYNLLAAYIPDKDEANTTERKTIAQQSKDFKDFLKEHDEGKSDFDNKLTQALNYNPKDKPDQ